MGQDTSTLGTSQLQDIASSHIERSAFSTAVPFLTELNRRLRESEDSAAVRAREQVLFFLGVGQLQQSDFHAAENAFSEFFSLFPNSDRIASARLYHADSFFYRRRWADARDQYAVLAQEGLQRDLAVELRAQFWERYADTVFIERDWDAGGSVFHQFKSALLDVPGLISADEKRAKASSYLLQAAMAQDDFPAALDLLPEIHPRAGNVRFDLALNLALLRGGDRLYEAQRLGEALYFYELVLNPDELLTFWQNQISRLQAELNRVAGVDWLADRRLLLQGELAQAEARVAVLDPMIAAESEDENRVPDYGPALTFRIARCYMARERFFEAFWAFERLERAAQTSADSDAAGFAEEALYGQVKMAAATQFEDRTRRLARRYLRSAPYVRFIGDVAYELLESTKRTEDEGAVRELTGIYLERVRLDPQLQEAPKLIYLVGATLMEAEDFRTLREQLAPILEEYPDRGFSDGLHYWLGLADILAGDFRNALDHFENIVGRYPDGGYTEDAHYRIGVAWFGLQHTTRAQRKLEGFLIDYPDSRLACEAHALLGDIAASDEEWTTALDAYADAREAGAWLDPPNLPYVNHAVFAGGDILAAQSRWVEMAEWYESYLRRWGRDGKAGDALYQLGRAQIARGQAEEMLELWIESILEFGNDPGDTGPDLMLREFAAHFRSARGHDPKDVLQDALAIAKAEDRVTLQLRLSKILRELDPASDGLVALSPDNEEAASAAVLLAAARVALAGDPARAAALAESAVSRDGWGPFSADALAILALAHTAQDNHRNAISAWAQLVQRFPDSEHAVLAWLRQGDLQRERGASAAAVSAYREVLKVREWRGEAWAEANYKIGLTHFEAGGYEAAFGFSQRVYVLYGAVTKWAAQAYLISGLALEKLDRVGDAIATYEELLADVRFAEEPAIEQARERIQALGGLS